MCLRQFKPCATTAIKNKRGRESFPGRTAEASRKKGTGVVVRSRPKPDRFAWKAVLVPFELTAYSFKRTPKSMIAG